MDDGVRAWWLFLCAASAVNVGLWLLSRRALSRRLAAAPPELPAGRRWHLLLSLGFVLGCAFRSFVPRADLQRICLVDSWVACVGVGRSVATVAELCFVTQWALTLNEAATTAGSRFARAVALATVPVIAIAEVCSWYAVLTTNALGNAVEQSIWTSTAALQGLAVASLWPRASARSRPWIAFVVLGALVFVAFMTSIDIPMYLRRWWEDEAAGRPYLGLLEGARDVFGRWVVTGSWADWHEELAWMAGYFSVCVWLSVGLAHAPRLEVRSPGDGPRAGA